jgi:hypothetical protein
VLDQQVALTRPRMGGARVDLGAEREGASKLNSPWDREP